MADIFLGWALGAAEKNGTVSRQGSKLPVIINSWFLRLR
jgi:hypothetical protein